mgnify:CR=1 FL=1
MLGKPTKTKIAATPTPSPTTTTTTGLLETTTSASTTSIVASVMPAEVKGQSLEITSEEIDSTGKNLFIAAKDPVAEPK